jgi:hypothetical protein
MPTLALAGAGDPRPKFTIRSTDIPNNAGGATMSLSFQYGGSATARFTATAAMSSLNGLGNFGPTGSTTGCSPMTDRRTVKLTTRAARQRAHALIDAAPEGYAVAIGEETRSQEQNAKLWPMISDIRQQVPGMAPFPPDDIKLRFLNALGQELRFLPELEGAGMFPVGQRSSTLSKSQFSALIELLYEYGARHGVQWSAKAQETIAAHTDPVRRAA